MVNLFGTILDKAMRLGSLVLVIVALISSVDKLYATDFMFEAVVAGNRIEGQPLNWDKQSMTVLGRDGQLHEFPHAQATNGRKTAPHFEPYSQRELRTQLQNEFGNQYEVNATQHYLVVHPNGRNDVWADRFEQLYRSFSNYFRVRGFAMQEPAYPLVAVVFPTRTEYDNYVQTSSVMAPIGALGHYEPRSNRVYLFDQAENSGDWEENASTVIHEATHQTAYNVGLHNRFAPQPRWASEGLAMMFESRGIHSPRSGDRQSDRINEERLGDYRDLVASSDPFSSLANFVSTDEHFNYKTMPAYAQSWALSFFLSETRPREFSQYLETLAKKPNFKNYSSSERVADFQRAFGDLEMLEVHFKRYLEKL